MGVRLHGSKIERSTGLDGYVKDNLSALGGASIVCRVMVSRRPGCFAKSLVRAGPSTTCLPVSTNTSRDQAVWQRAAGSLKQQSSRLSGSTVARRRSQRSMLARSAGRLEGQSRVACAEGPQRALDGQGVFRPAASGSITAIGDGDRITFLVSAWRQPACGEGYVQNLHKVFYTNVFTPPPGCRPFSSSVDVMRCLPGYESKSSSSSRLHRKSSTRSAVRR